MSKRITVYSNDPNTPRFELSLKGEITLDVKLTPVSLIFGEVLLDKKATKPFELELLEPEKVKVKSVRCEDERFAIRKIEDDGKGKSSFEVTFNGAKEQGRITAKAIVELEGTDVPRIEYTIRINVVGNLKYSQHVYLLKRNGEYQPREISITSRAPDTKFAIKSAEDPAGNLILKVNKKSASETVLNISGFVLTAKYSYDTEGGLDFKSKIC